MKVAIITDQHFGARKNSKLFHDYFLKFYNDVFFPTIEERGIDTIIDMGDTFDNRKGIDFAALDWSKKNYYDKLSHCKIHTIVGNHTAYYKNTNTVNAIDLLLREYDNIICYSEATETKFGRLKVLFVPWMNSENEQSTLTKIAKSKAKMVMGHLEINGFTATRGHVMMDGYESNIFDKFAKVFSGHYHTRSNNGKIYYLGNPYEMFANDTGDDRGFHIFDTETLETEEIRNPYRLFHTITYEDNDHQTFDGRQFKDKIVKLLVKKKSFPKKFDQFVDKLYAADVAELKIIENFQEEIDHDNIDIESEDTISLLNRYVEESDSNINKSQIQSLIQDIYKEACELV
jgi:hypothetical protein|tara:strand:+ start:590 stop:1624 length:1035 start_codon:yes stop_codon:yes gene_type:complete